METESDPEVPSAGCMQLLNDKDNGNGDKNLKMGESSRSVFCEKRKTGKASSFTLTHSQLRSLPGIHIDDSCKILVTSDASAGFGYFDSSVLRYSMVKKWIDKAREDGHLVNYENTLILHTDFNSYSDNSIVMYATRETISQGFRVVVVVDQEAKRGQILSFRSIGAKLIRCAQGKTLVETAEAFQRRLPKSYFMNIESEMKSHDYSSILDDIADSVPNSIQVDLLIGPADILRCFDAKIAEDKCIAGSPTMISSDLEIPDSSDEMEAFAHFQSPQSEDKILVESLNQLVLTSKEAYSMTRKLFECEGMLCSGILVTLALKAIETIKHQSQKNVRTCLVFIPSSLKLHLAGSFSCLNDQWMIDNEYLTQEEVDDNRWYSSMQIGTLLSATLPSIHINSTVNKATTILKMENNLHLAVVDDDNSIIGIITSNLICYLENGTLTGDEHLIDLQGEEMCRQFAKIALRGTMRELEELHKESWYVIVTDMDCHAVKETAIGLITPEDILRWISETENYHRTVFNWDLQLQRHISS